MDLADFLLSCSDSLHTSISNGSLARASSFKDEITYAISNAVARRSARPKSVIFVFHCNLPADCSKISYRDISGDQARSDYEDMIGLHAYLSSKINPDSLWLLVTDQEFQPNIDNQNVLESRGQVAVARLPLDPYQLMFERVLCMYSYRLGVGRDYDTSFVDGDAFIMQNLSPLWRAPFNIYLTYRRTPGLMPVNEGVFHVRGGTPAVKFARYHLAQLEWLESLEVVRDYYGNDIRRWRGGQLALNSIANILLRSSWSTSNDFDICMLPCFYHNSTPTVPSSPYDISKKSIVHLKGNMKDCLGQLKAYTAAIHQH